mmetsp:Transcript_35687/g.86123  ORF Transcript_35687/g.86123 Transcript_35687/m.86123 type:complete len:210 (+) Transcript_35687:1196-1825(+)
MGRQSRLRLFTNQFLSCCFSNPVAAPNAPYVRSVGYGCSTCCLDSIHDLNRSTADWSSLGWPVRSFRLFEEDDEEEDVEVDDSWETDAATDGIVSGERWVRFDDDDTGLGRQSRQGAPDRGAPEAAGRAQTLDGTLDGVGSDGGRGTAKTPFAPSLRSPGATTPPSSSSPDADTALLHAPPPGDRNGSSCGPPPLLASSRRRLPYPPAT